MDKTAFKGLSHILLNIRLSAHDHSEIFFRQKNKYHSAYSPELAPCACLTLSTNHFTAPDLARTRPSNCQMKYTLLNQLST